MRGKSGDSRRSYKESRRRWKRRVGAVGGGERGVEAMVSTGSQDTRGEERDCVLESQSSRKPEQQDVSDAMLSLSSSHLAWHVIQHRPVHSSAILDTNLMLGSPLLSALSKELQRSAPETYHKIEKVLTSERVLMVSNDRFDRCHDAILVLLRRKTRWNAISGVRRQGDGVGELWLGWEPCPSSYNRLDTSFVLFLS